MRKVFKGLTFINIALLSLAFGGCGNRQEPWEGVARVNDYILSEEDFREELKNADYAGEESMDAELMLEIAVQRQVLIQEAQRQGLQQQKIFLKTIERYWKQTLIKELLNKENQRIMERVAPEKQTEAMQQWIDNLRKQADITINKSVLKNITHNESKK